MNPVLAGIFFRTYELFCAAVAFAALSIALAFAVTAIASIGKMKPPKDSDDDF